MSEALRLADLVEHDPLAYSDDAAAELRRLSAELAALKAAIEAQGVPDGYAGSLYVSGAEHCVTVEFESAAQAQAYQNWLASAPPAPQAKPQPDPLHDDIQSVLFEVEQAIQNGCCPWQVEAAFEAYEAARRLQQPAHGITKE